MSVYFQDDMTAVETNDGVVFLFTKGGDNNLICDETNKRHSSWSLAGVFKNKEHAMRKVDEYLLGSFSGGSWQLQSLKDKTFPGYTDVLGTIAKRFEVTLRKALKINWNHSDINKNSVRDFSNDVIKLFRNSNITLGTQVGYGVGIVWSNYDSKLTEEEDSVERVQVLNVDETFTGEYAKFCVKYMGFSKFDLLESDEFCKEISLHDSSYDCGYDFLSSFKIGHKLRGLSYENFAVIMNSEFAIKKFLDDYKPEDCIATFPYHFKKLLETNYVDKLKELISNTTYEYSIESYNKNLKILIDAGLNTLCIEYDKKIEDSLHKAKNSFILNWNRLAEYCWYTRTKTMLPELIADLKILKSAGSFEIKECFVKSENDAYCENMDFYKIISYYENQRKTNQKSIKDAVGYLVNNFAEYIDDSIVSTWINYFNIKLQK